MITYLTVPPQGYIGLHISLSHTTWLHNVTHFTIPPQDYIFHYPNTTTIRVTYFTIPPQDYIFHYPNTTTIRVTYFTIPPQGYIFHYPTTGLHISISHHRVTYFNIPSHSRISGQRQRLVFQDTGDANSSLILSDTSSSIRRCLGKATSRCTAVSK